jgi:hypothetical protein
MMAGNARLKILSTDFQECGLYCKLEYLQKHKLRCGYLPTFTQLNILAETRLMCEKTFFDRCRRISFAADVCMATRLSFTYPEERILRTRFQI